MKILLSATVLCAALAVTTVAAAQNVIRVPADFPTIQAGISAASPGDTVLVAPGTYSGTNNRNLSFYGKAVTLRSEAGAAATVIDCGAVARCFVFNSGEGNDTVVDGFTIQNGRADDIGDGGGCIRCNSSSPTIRNSVIRNCISTNIGGGMLAGVPSKPIIDNCEFLYNGSYSHGGGIYGQAVLTNTVFYGNEALLIGSSWADGGAAHLDGTSEIKSCRFIGNNAVRGGALWLGGDKTLVNCLFVGNGALIPGSGPRGGALYVASGHVNVFFGTFSGNDALLDGYSVYTTESGTAHFVHSILWDSPSSGIASATPGSVTAYYSNIRMTPGSTYPGDGNLNANPLFVSRGLGSLDDGSYLSHVAAGQGATSPCVDAGVPAAIPSVWCNVGYGSGVCLDSTTTRTDGVPDGGVTDLGFHYYDPPLFADGFETGTLEMWSSAVP